MKKLMIVAAIALAASFGYGAAATWGTEWAYADITGFSNYDDSSTHGTYWFLGLASTDTSGISVDKDGNITTGGATILDTGDITGVNQYASGTVSGVSAGQYVALVIYDSDAVAGDYVGAYGIGVRQVSADASDDPPVTGEIPNFGELAANIGIVGGGNTDIPEPTSGLLLLVGGAMLALRRRRA